MNKRLIDIVSAVVATSFIVNTAGIYNCVKVVDDMPIEARQLDTIPFATKKAAFLEEIEQLIIENEKNKIRQEEENRIMAEKERIEQEKLAKKAEEERLQQEEEMRKAEEERLSITPNYNPFNLTEKSNLTTEMAIKMLNGSALQNAAAAYVYAEEVYGVNAIFLMSLTSLESGHGRSELAMYRNNIGGVKSSSGDWAYFSDWGECIMYIASFIKELYLNEDGAYYNGKSIWAVNIKYCADSSPWADMINSIANDLLAKV